LLRHRLIREKNSGCLILSLFLSWPLTKPNRHSVYIRPGGVRRYSLLQSNFEGCRCSLRSLCHRGSQEELQTTTHSSCKLSPEFHSAPTQSANGNSRSIFPSQGVRGKREQRPAWPPQWQVSQIVPEQPRSLLTQAPIKDTPPTGKTGGL
jgi:hypothetical protein